MKKISMIALVLVLTACAFTGCRRNVPQDTSVPTTMPTQATTRPTTAPTTRPTTEPTTPSTNATFPDMDGAMDGTDGFTNETGATTETHARSRRGSMNRD